MRDKLQRIYIILKFRNLVSTIYLAYVVPRSVKNVDKCNCKVFPHQVNKRENSKRRVFGLLLCLKRVVTQIAKTYHFGINTKLKY